MSVFFHLILIFIANCDKWRAFNLEESCIGIVDPCYQATISVSDSFVSDDVWLGWSLCPGSGNMSSLRYRRPMSTPHFCHTCIRIPLSIERWSRDLWIIIGCRLLAFVDVFIYHPGGRSRLLPVWLNAHVKHGNALSTGYRLRKRICIRLRKCIV